MFKLLATVLCTGLVTLLPSTYAAERQIPAKPALPLYPAVFLKPGESQQLDLAAPELLIGARDRTNYDFTPVDEKGDKSPALKGITIAEDRQRMGELWDHYGQRYVAVKFSSTADAETGKFLIRVHAVRFGGQPNYETTVRLTVSK